MKITMFSLVHQCCWQALSATATEATIERLKTILGLGKMVGISYNVVRGPQNRAELFLTSRAMISEMVDLVQPALQWMLTGDTQGILAIYKFSPQEVELVRRVLLEEMGILC